MTTCVTEGVRRERLPPSFLMSCGRSRLECACTPLAKSEEKERLLAVQPQISASTRMQIAHLASINNSAQKWFRIIFPCTQAHIYFVQNKFLQCVIPDNIDCHHLTGGCLGFSSVWIILLHLQNFLFKILPHVKHCSLQIPNNFSVFFLGTN